MSRIFLISNRRKITVGLGLMLLFGSGLLVFSTTSNRPVVSMSCPASSRMSESQASERIESELITIKPSGFDPLEIRRPVGRFYLRINNRSEINDLELRLDREQGPRVQDVRLPRGRLAWNKILELPPGKYVLSEVNHPEWVCTITITAR